MYCHVVEERRKQQNLKIPVLAVAEKYSKNAAENRHKEPLGSSSLFFIGSII